MKNLLKTLAASIVLLSASVALAAPPAQAPARTACSHCATQMSAKTPAGPGATLFGGAHRPCQHGAAIAVRWGNAQKPCPHCAHHT